jgi:ABC-type uncharacterized transport system permease subunit
MVANTSLGYDLILALLLVVVVSFVLRRTTFGFRLRFTGANEEAARRAGIRTTFTTVLAFAVSGALAGLAGCSLILSSETGTLTDNFSAGYGFAGIVVALLARNKPAGVVPAALLLASLRQGGGLMEASVGVPASLVLITQGLVILLVAATAFVVERLWVVRVDAPTPAPDLTPAASMVKEAGR